VIQRRAVVLARGRRVGVAARRHRNGAAVRASRRLELVGTPQRSTAALCSRSSNLYPAASRTPGSGGRGLAGGPRRRNG
jgi:hypothetical protein